MAGSVLSDKKGNQKGQSWREDIPAVDWAIYNAAGYGERLRPGETPAMLVVDVTYGFVGRERLPIEEAISQYPNACGLSAWDALPNIESVLTASRAAACPIFYTAGVTSNAVHHAGRWREKHPRTLAQPDDSQTIVRQVAPLTGDIMVEKTKPSAFFGTPLVASLIDLGIDTLIVTGCTTSGCIRATVVDAFSNGFSTIVVEDGVFDRSALSHSVNLFDMDQKYANVLPATDVVSYMEELRSTEQTESQRSVS